MLITAFALTAQINTSIWGVTLGKSTKEHVKRVIKKKGYKNYDGHDNCFVVLPSSGLDYAGTHWAGVSFDFYNNTLFRIMFINMDESYSVYERDFGNLSSMLDKKYHKYYDFSTDRSIYFDDGKTLVSLMLRDGGLALFYTNNRLNALKEKAEDDEL